jgi:hypothetical protein
MAGSLCPSDQNGPRSLPRSLGTRRLGRCFCSEASLGEEWEPSHLLNLVIIFNQYIYILIELIDIVPRLGEKSNPQEAPEAVVW